MNDGKGLRVGGGGGIVEASKGYSGSGGERQDELMNGSVGLYVLYISRSWLTSGASGRALP